MPETVQPGTLYIVPTPIGNLADITYRAVTVLSAVDVIAAEDTRVTGVLLAHYGISKPLLSYHNYNERERAPKILANLRSGRSIALVTDAGTPGISDPAFYIVRETLQAGLPVIPLPGASAVLPALVASGLPTERFVFEGFLPQKKGRKTRLEALKNESRTVVFYESPHRVHKLLHQILEVLGDRPVAVVRELTKKFEEVERGQLSAVLAKLEKKEPRGEYVVVLGGCGDEQENGESETD